MNQRPHSLRAQFLFAILLCVGACCYGALAAGFLAGMSAPSALAAEPRVSIAPDVPLSQTISRNWAGYVAQGKKFTAISGSWTVPAAQNATTTRLGAEATWVGIGGVAADDLIQAGTQTVVEDGQVTYQAWYELLPDFSQEIPLAVNAGDSVSVSLAEVSTNHWLLMFVDNTTAKSYRTTLSYTSLYSSAEWVEESPLSATTGNYIPLSNFGSVSFANGHVIADGQSLSIAQSGAEALRMGLDSSRVLATPSALAQSGSAFSVARSDVAAAPPSRRRATVYSDDSGVIYFALPDGQGGYVVRVILSQGLGL